MRSISLLVASVKIPAWANLPSLRSHQDRSLPSPDWRTSQTVSPKRRLGEQSARGAFTLLELLICIAIIAILAVIAIPSVKKLYRSAQSVQCISNLKTLYAGMLAYAADYQMELPCDRENPQTAYSWYAPLRNLGYVKHAGFGKKLPPYFCPANPAPAPPSGAPGFTNYAMNGNFILVNTAVQGGDPDYLSKRKSLKFNQIHGIKALLVDSFISNENQPNYATFGYASGSIPWRDVSAVHGDRVNVLFTDGHIESPRVSPRTINAEHDLNELKQSWFYPVQ